MEINLNKVIGRAIHCRSRRESRNLLLFLHKNGFVWVNGRIIDPYTDISMMVHEDKTCYICNSNKTVSISGTHYGINYVEFDAILGY